MYLEPCSAQQLQEIYDELNITEESLQRDIQYLIEWLEQTPYLPSIKDNDTLKNFLVGCKNSVERTKAHIDYYYSRRTLGQDLFAYRDPASDAIRNAYKFVSMTPLPKLSPDGCRVTVAHISANYEEKLPKWDSMLSLYQLQYEIVNKVDKNKGIVMIIDFGNMPLGFGAMLAQDFKAVADLNQKTTRMRWKKIYFLNPGTLVHQVVRLLKATMSEKLWNRVEVWRKDPKNLVEVLPKEILPSNFGGNEASIEELKERWYEYMMEFRDWFKSEENVKADISKRPKDDSLSAEFSNMGVAGSFRKINID